MNLNPADELKEEQGLVIFNPVRSLKCICMMYLLQYEPNNQLSNVCGDALYEERVRIDVEKSCSEPEIQMSDELTYAVENYEPNINLSDVYDVAFYERRARIEDNKSCSEPEVHMSDEFNSAVQQYEPNIQLSNVYSDALYEGRLRIDVDKSCSEPEAHMTSEFNPAVVYDITLNEGGVKVDDDKSCSKLEVHTSDEFNSAVGQEKSMHFKQSAVKNVSNKSESSDEFEWPSSDSSDEGKKSPLDSSDEWKMPPHVSSDEWEMRSSHSSDKSETSPSPSNDSCDSSNSSDKNEVAAKKKKNLQSKVNELSEYEKKIQKNRDEKLAFLQSLRMNEVKEDLNEAIMNLKPPKRKLKCIWPKHPTRKSVRLTNVHFDFSEQALQRHSFYCIEEETKKNNTEKCAKKSAGKYKKFTKSKSYQVQDESESSDDLEILSNTSDDNDVSECSHENEVKGDLNEVVRNPIPGSSTRGAETSTRRSCRLVKVNIDLSEEALLARSLAAVRKEFKENKMKRKSAPDKSKPVSKTVYKHTSETLDSLPLRTPPLQCWQKLPPILTFEKAITGDHIYADFIRDYDDLDYIDPRPFTDYVSCFPKMKTDPSKIVKIFDVGITALAFHPMKEKIILSAGNRYGAIGFWHVTSDSVPYVFKPHLLEVSCMKFFDDNLNQIISCSFDGTMRCGDLEKKVFIEVFNISKEISCNYFDFISPTTTVVCHDNGNVSVVDLRSDSKSAEKSCKCYTCAVTTVSVHPVNKNYFVSADKEGFISLWDLRKLEKPVIGVNPHGTSITSAFFSPVSGNSILVSSVSDNSLCLLDSSVLGISLPLYKKVWHDFDYESRRPKAFWLPNNDNAFVVGSTWNPRRIQVFNNHLENIYNFKDEYLSHRTSNNIFHPSLPVLAAGYVHDQTSKVYIFS